METAGGFVKRYFYITAFFCIGVPAYFGIEYAVDHFRNPQAAVVSKKIKNQLPEFALQTQDGRRFYRSSLEDKVTLVNFVFRSCLHVCPMLMGQTKLVMQQIKSNADVLQFASITVDPNNDNVAVMKEWKDEFAPSLDNWFFLTASKEAIIDLVRDGFHLPVEQTVTEQHGPILHSSKIALVDQKARIRGYFGVETAEERKALAQAFEKVAAEGKIQASL
jgi:protein SCO1/2